ncbi:MAG TPA: sodium/proline symporter [Chlamydiales bacterium]|nr:sodium/proline symporter [Chlamydiales bacterium]
MRLLEITTFTIYFSVLLGLVFLISKRQKSDTEFVLGNRSMNFWLTALSAHASDMSSWLLMAYPAIIYSSGIFNAWVAIGLTGFMYLNWQFIAPKIRSETEKYNSLTVNAYFASKLNDEKNSIRTFSAILSLFFFLIYISAGLVSLGLLVESLFGLSYYTGITIGLFIVLFYVFLGGYLTVAWIDLFQGFFLLGVILFIAFYLLSNFESTDQILIVMKSKGLTTSLIPAFNIQTFAKIIMISGAWGLGYLGQPHIITKFMGIKKISEMHKAKYVGITWQALALLCVTIIGVLGIGIFPNGMDNNELILLNIVKFALPPMFAGLVLCAILAATTNVMAAQILVTASSLAEDFYKNIINKKASHKKILKISRISVFIVGFFAYCIAFFKISSIYNLVLYAWSGLGASFGPLLLMCLYDKKINKKGAISGLITGGVLSALWPSVNTSIAPIIPAFTLSLLTIYLVSRLTRRTQCLNPKS